VKALKAFALWWPMWLFLIGVVLIAHGMGL
jgi:hypothetical protein